MSHEILLVWFENEYFCWRSKATISEISLLKDEVKAYNNWIESLFKGLAPGSSYANPDDADNWLLASKSNYERILPKPGLKKYYENPHFYFKVVDITKPKDKDDLELIDMYHDSNIERLDPKSLREILERPLGNDEISLGFRVLPATRMIFLETNVTVEAPKKVLSTKIVKKVVSPKKEIQIKTIPKSTSLQKSVNPTPAPSLNKLYTQEITAPYGSIISSKLYTSGIASPNPVRKIWFIFPEGDPRYPFLEDLISEVKGRRNESIDDINSNDVVIYVVDVTGRVGHEIPNRLKPYLERTKNLVLLALEYEGIYQPDWLYSKIDDRDHIIHAKVIKKFTQSGITQSLNDKNGVVSEILSL